MKSNLLTRDYDLKELVGRWTVQVVKSNYLDFVCSLDGCQNAYKLSQVNTEQKKTLLIANVDYRRCSINIHTDILLVY